MPFVTELTIPFQPATDPAELEVRRETRQAEQTATLNGAAALDLHCELSGLHWALGEGALALETLQRALRLASESNALEWIGYLMSLQGAALCYVGQYQAAYEIFTQAELIFKRSNDGLGVAWQQHLMAREYHLDQGNYSLAQRYLMAAMPVFRSGGIWHAYAENLLTQAHAALNLGELRRAADLMKQADGLITERELAWYASEYYWLRARIALAEGTPKAATKYCYSGLNAISNGGDLRVLSPLYFTLGIALETDRSQQAAAQDAFDRALQTARIRARRLHVAQAFHAAGLHLKRYSQRMTVRARGSGYLFEADRLYKALGLPMPEV